jgi:hypothetical protein
LCDVVDDIRRVGTNAGIVFDARGRLSIKIFASNREADNKIGKGGAVYLDSGCQGRDLVGNFTLST